MDGDHAAPNPILSPDAHARLNAFRLLADLAEVDLLVSDGLGGQFLACNASAHEHLGYSEAELLQLSPERLQAGP